LASSEPASTHNSERELEIPVATSTRQDQCAARIRALAAFLREHRTLWTLRTKAEDSAAEASGAADTEWGREHPQLLAWLQKLARHPPTGNDVLSLEPWGSDAPAAMVEWQRSAEQLTHLPELPDSPLELSKHHARNVPGRKWGQVQALCRATLALPTPQEGYVDCCSGKGHLGRTLALATQKPTVLVERNATLCDRAAELAAAAGAPAVTRRCDVLTPRFVEELSPRQTAVALHACGDLHLAVASALRQGRLGAAAMAPCCYFRTASLPFRGLSRAGRASGLTLDAHTLSFSTCGAVIASPACKSRLTQRHAWENGFKLWYRARTGQPWNLPKRRITRAELTSDFFHLCRQRAAQAGISLDSRQELASYEEEGWYRLRYAAAVERLRQPFRRALETWLFLDRGAWLAEAGLHVQAGTFCDRQLTPRNLAWIAYWS
jgi:hypothetical protein